MGEGLGLGFDWGSIFGSGANEFIGDLGKTTLPTIAPISTEDITGVLGAETIDSGLGINMKNMFGNDNIFGKEGLLSGKNLLGAGQLLYGMSRDKEADGRYDRAEARNIKREEDRKKHNKKIASSMNPSANVGL